MRRFLPLILVVAVFITVVASVSFASEDLYGKYLTVADVQKATELTGITRKEIAITLKFYSSAGTEILEAGFNPPAFYHTEVDGNQKYYTAVPDIGEKAAIGIPNMPYRITFLKGKFCVMLQTMPKDGKLPVTKDQLIAIAKIIAGRL